MNKLIELMRFLDDAYPNSEIHISKKQFMTNIFIKINDKYKFQLSGDGGQLNLCADKLLQSIKELSRKGELPDFFKVNS